MLGPAFLLIICSLSFIASGMHRHQRDKAFAPLQRFGSATLRRYLGFLWLVLALVLLSMNNSISHALVEWFGLFSVASILIMTLSSLGKTG